MNNYKPLVILLIFLLHCQVSFANQRNWSADESLDIITQGNPLALSEQSFGEAIDAGIIHSLNYPVDTGVHFPYLPFKTMFTIKHKNPIKTSIQKVIKKVTKANSLIDVQKDLGLAEYPETLDDPDLPYYIPDSAIFDRGKQRMGFTIKEINNVSAFTISCAQCHTANLFGKAVIGLSNRFPKPNEFFVRVKDLFSAVPLASLKLTAPYTKNEYKLLKKAKNKLKFVGAHNPSTLGLDTSLAQVSLSLALRNQDPTASIPKTPNLRAYNKHPLRKLVADSKPMVWWNTKYKNKFLADGSVISGNPILTNILWNEIGRGADLTVLNKWIKDNQKIIDELTTTVFSSQAPKMIDFVGEDYFSDLDKLKKGEKVYDKACAKCHGNYEKAWSSNNTDELSISELITTLKVDYNEQIDAKDVGTDPERHKAMKYLIPLNKLKISKKNNIKIKTKRGYIPPPLVGIWARWPYMHNNSIPSLCELLQPHTKRKPEYMARPANDIEKDFDTQCNGYPTVDRVNKSSAYYFNATKKGLTNTGHDKNILLNKNGKEILTSNDKMNLIYYLQTL